MEMTRSQMGQLCEKLPDEGDVLLHQRIKAELKRLGSPANLYDLAGRANCLQRHLQSH